MHNLLQLVTSNQHTICLEVKFAEFHDVAKLN